jgi:hypothetical protein
MKTYQISLSVKEMGTRRAIGVGIRVLAQVRNGSRVAHTADFRSSTPVCENLVLTDCLLINNSGVVHSIGPKFKSCSLSDEVHHRATRIQVPKNHYIVAYLQRNRPLYIILI